MYTLHLPEDEPEIHFLVLAQQKCTEHQSACFHRLLKTVLKLELMATEVQ
jgi:hypothetical protein